MVIVLQLCECTKNHWFIHFKQENFMACKLSLNKAVEGRKEGREGGSDREGEKTRKGTGKGGRRKQ